VLEDKLEINTALDDDDKVSKTKGVVESGKPMKVIFLYCVFNKHCPFTNNSYQI
jgi:hypothetical protein